MHLALEEAPCGVVEFCDAGIVRGANSTLGRWIGVSVDALVGKKVEAIFTVANRIFYQTHLFPLLKLHGQADEIFLSLLAADGSSVPVIASARRTIADGQARTQCVFLTVHRRREYEDEILRTRKLAEDALVNNTELAAAKHEADLRTQELEQRVRDVQWRSEELQRVSQILSHDLREPIRKIGLFTDLAREHLGGTADPDVLSALTKVDQQAKQMEGLLGAMGEFLNADAREPLETISLNEVVNEAAAAVSTDLRFADWSIERQPLPMMFGRRKQIRLLFIHLLENAVKFRDPGRRLNVQVTARVVQENAYEATKDRYRYVDFARIEVRDNGRGFDPKYRDYVFRLLKKVDLESSGLGIGLAICRKIAEAHYGSIRVDTQPRQGATFILLLPTGLPPLAPQTVSPPSGAS